MTTESFPVRRNIAALKTPLSDRPLYQQLRDRLKAELADGNWKPGDALPTERELCQRFDLSPGTVRQAILALVREGLLTRRAGKGTFVARMDPSRGFERFFPFRSGTSDGQFTPDIEVLDVHVMAEADEEVLTKLDLRRPDSILSVRRLMVQHGTPVCWHQSYIPYSLVPGMEKEDLTQQLYRTMEAKFGLHVIQAEELLQAVEADAEMARLLQISEGAPVILIERVAYTFRGQVLECRKTYGRSDKFLYKIQLR